MTRLRLRDACSAEVCSRDVPPPKTRSHRPGVSLGCRLGKNRPAPHPGRQAVGVQGTCSRRCRFECPEFLDILGATFPRTKVDCVLFGK